MRTWIVALTYVAYAMRYLNNFGVNTSLLECFQSLKTGLRGSKDIRCPKGDGKGIDRPKIVTYGALRMEKVRS